MKKIISTLFAGLILSFPAFAQVTPIVKPQHTVTNGSSNSPADAIGADLPYISFNDDPLNLRIYTLPNGLQIWLSENHDEPRIQTMIAVKTGSKNDPATHTGLAHYLEHLMFKGTMNYGTLDYTKEKPYLDQITKLFEQYDVTTDSLIRNKLYNRIDSISGLAAQFAIPNEYDKMMSALGVSGTNAFTSNDQTVYVDDIPSYAVEPWLQIESERFFDPVFRLFHTELEAVYEEKNIGLDNDNRKINEALMAALFKNHPYGTQTTIGSIEHLKNPSLVEIQKYFDTYYVPNNMAIILSGDFNSEEIMLKISKYFSKFKNNTVPVFTFKPEAVNTSPIMKVVHGPTPASIAMGFHFPGAGTKDAITLEVVDNILSNSVAGLIDLNLVKQQKVLSAGSYTSMMKDYSVHFFRATPLAGQTLDQCKDLLWSQINLLKKGNFDESLVAAIINNLKLQEMQNYEDNSGRAYSMMDLFINEIDYQQYMERFTIMSKLTKKDIMDFAAKYYTSDYAVVYKEQGKDTDVKKVPKPHITPIELNRDTSSAFLQKIQKFAGTNSKPVFLDYEKDIQKGKLSEQVDFLEVKNTKNQLFELYYVFDMGNNNDLTQSLALEYLKYLGTDKLTADQVSVSFYKLACNFNVNVGNEQVYVSLSGLQENFVPAVQLLENLLSNCKADTVALKNFVQGKLKARDDAKKNKNMILQRLSDYLTYGPVNPSTHVLSTAELQHVTADKLVSSIKTLNSYPHHVLYYGPLGSDQALALVKDTHKLPLTPLVINPPVIFPRNEMNENKVFYVNYDMVQAEILWKRKLMPFNTVEIPQFTLFNEYFGSGMSGLVFQNLRESKALAYSTYSIINTPVKTGDPFYITSYIGTQADKLPEAIASMNELQNNIPLQDASFNDAKKAILGKMQTERILKSDILFNYLSAKKRRLSTDIRLLTYQQLPNLDINMISKVGSNYYSKPFYYGVLGSKDKINFKTLESIGTVKELILTDIFGY